MRILVLGGDGYLGWPTAMRLSKQGHDVTIIDNMLKRYWEASIGVEPLTEIRPLQVRVKRWEQLTGKKIEYFVGDIAEHARFVYKIVNQVRPSAIVHYAEQPSAPFSMMSRNSCIETQRNNVLGTLNVLFAIQHVDPNIHVVKLGTMGEYGTPNIDIEEGWLTIEHKGREDRVLYPKKPGSFYHLSKVHDSANLEFACRVWGLRVTDLNQGVVYGIDTEDSTLHSDLVTSFHYDSIFGTVLNRFVVQAIVGLPLTVYGKGEQTRGFLNILDTLQCVQLALENPPSPGEFRVFNQFTEQFSINELAEKVVDTCAQRGTEVTVDHIPNPRTELEEHYYNATHSALLDLGLEPHYLDTAVISHMLDVVEKHRNRIESSLVMPNVKWQQR